jgi:hypothetical protein
MEKEHIVILKPRPSQLKGKMSIETKVSVSHAPLAQTTKNATKPAINNLSNYCLKHYVRLSSPPCSKGRPIPFVTPPPPTPPKDRGARGRGATGR